MSEETKKHESELSEEQLEQVAGGAQTPDDGRVGSTTPDDGLSRESKVAQWYRSCHEAPSGPSILFLKDLQTDLASARPNHGTCRGRENGAGSDSVAEFSKWFSKKITCLLTMY